MPGWGEQNTPEELRLKYRFLDLRRERGCTATSSPAPSHFLDPAPHDRSRLHGISDAHSERLRAPEGARDFWSHLASMPGRFYALPQSPQLFKQLLMIAGFDRYFQIAPCFRDEDARADRSPGEFYQLDIEMSFVEQEDIFQAIEPVLRGVFEEFGNGWRVTQKFPRIPYAEAIRKYGSDKPDLRNPIEMQDVTEHFAGSGFKVFAGQDRRRSRASKSWAIPPRPGAAAPFATA